MVDDNSMNLTVFKGLVRQTKMKVDTAEDGNTGLALAKDKKYDIIFRIPQEYEKLWNSLKEETQKYNYDGIIRLLDEEKNA